MSLNLDSGELLQCADSKHDPILDYCCLHDNTLEFDSVVFFLFFFKCVDYSVVKHTPPFARFSLFVLHQHDDCTSCLASKHGMGTQPLAGWHVFLPLV